MGMKGNVAVMALVSIVSGSAFASCCDCFTGHYVGIAGGIAVANAELSSSAAVSSAALGSASANSSVTSADVSPWGEVFIGSGFQWGSHLYLGARFGVNFSSYQDQLQGAGTIVPSGSTALAINGDLDIKQRLHEYSLDFKPGFVFCDCTMIYGLIGAAFNRTTIDGTATGTQSGTNTFSKSKGQVGFRGGLGLEHMLTRCLSIYGNFVYTRFSTVNLSHSGTFGAVSASAILSAQPQKYVSSMGIALYF